MEVKIKRTYKVNTKATYNITYQKNKSFSRKEWTIRLKKERYGWGLHEIENITTNLRSGWWGNRATINNAMPREVILKIENIIRGLNSNNGMV